ncbi:MAG: cobalamin B12-binding domain-containing protein [Thermodesulfobacteriota bacterium]
MEEVKAGRKIRVLIGKVGLDGHDVGARLVAKALADAGMEVVYTGLRQSPTMIVNAAVQEDVDVIGISILSGSHLYLLSEIFADMKKANVNLPVIMGGIIPYEDIPVLKGMGVIGVFLPETPLARIVDFVKEVLTVRLEGAAC